MKKASALVNQDCQRYYNNCVYYRSIRGRRRNQPQHVVDLPQYRLVGYKLSLVGCGMSERDTIRNYHIDGLGLIFAH